jgi:hypothetical protein
MSYTLRGRLESRLATMVPALVLACVLGALLRELWPLQLAALMLAAGLVLDVAAYDRLIDYQPGWLAVPLGLLELAAAMALVGLLGVEAPLVPALAFFLASWLLAQALSHAALPLAVLSYGEDGGELGRAGAVAAIAVTVLLAGAGGVAWATRPPTIHLDAGVHAGPIVIRESQVLDGEPGTIVRGGIRILADDVTVRDVTVLGGQDGILVENARDVVLERVSIAGARMDGVRVRRSEIAIRDCRIDMVGRTYGQGIDISFGFDLATSVVDGCTVLGGQEGIVSHFAHVMITGNRVARTTMRGIAVTEMSMGMVARNEVGGGRGVGIFCSDYSMCEIRDNTVHGIRPEPDTEDASRMGHAIVAQFAADATLGENIMYGNAGGTRSFSDSEIRHGDGDER